MNLGALSIATKTAGSLFSFGAARKRKKAIKRAVKGNKKRVNAFTDDFVGRATDVQEKKDGILENSADVFERIGGSIFGDTQALSNLRNAQDDYARLAAGDASGFLQETGAIVSSALANSYGGPRGQFENTSAANLFTFRSQGLQNALSITNNFERQGQNLIGTEFGIIDQGFERHLNLESNRVNQLNQLDLQAAGVEGSDLAALGTGLSGVAQGIDSYATRQNNLQIAQTQSDGRRWASGQVGASGGRLPAPAPTQPTGFIPQIIQGAKSMISGGYQPSPESYGSAKDGIPYGGYSSTSPSYSASPSSSYTPQGYLDQNEPDYSNPPGMPEWGINHEDPPGGWDNYSIAESVPKSVSPASVEPYRSPGYNFPRYDGPRVPVTPYMQQFSDTGEAILESGKNFYEGVKGRASRLFSDDPLSFFDPPEIGVTQGVDRVMVDDGRRSLDVRPVKQEPQVSNEFQGAGGTMLPMLDFGI